MSRVTYANTPATAAQERLRLTNGVRVVNAAEEGTGVNALPRGVYGYTYSPGLTNAPLWAVRRYRAYETHKLADGEILVMGFADADTANRISSASDVQTVQIHPEPSAGADVLVQVPYSRIARHRQHAAPNQDGFTVTLEPAAAPVHC
jgi:hypothetical protein